MIFRRKDTGEDAENRPAGDAQNVPPQEAEEADPPSKTISLERQEFASVQDLTPSPDMVEGGDYQIVPKDTGEDARQGGWYLELKTTRTSVAPIRVLVAGDAVLGRTDAADIALDDLDASLQGVSRRHALLRPTPTHLYLIELGSTNGTLLNGLPLGPGMARPLRDDDVINLGKLRLTVKLHGASNDTRPNMSVVDLYIPDVLEQRDRTARWRDLRDISTGRVAGYEEEID